MIGIIAPVLAIEEFVEIRDGQVQSLCFHPAGQGINVARAVRELGEECTVVGFNGGESGTVLRALLDEYGLHHRLVQMQGQTAAVVKLTSAHHERQTYRLAPPSVSRHEADDLYTAASLLVMECPIVILQSVLPDGVPPDFFERLVRLASAYQVQTVADVESEYLPGVLEAGPTVIKPNVDQLRRHYSISGDPSSDELLAIADDLRARGAGAVALSAGELGAVVVDGEGAWQLQPPHVESVVERGAGDCMTGGLTVGLYRGLSLVEAAKLGAAAGCAKVMRHGLGSCKRDVTETLLPRVEVKRLR